MCFTPSEGTIAKIIQYFDSPNKKAQALHLGQPMINMKQTLLLFLKRPPYCNDFSLALCYHFLELLDSLMP